MRSSKIIFTFLILLVSVLFCVGQEKPKAVLIDQFGRIPCDQFLARFDNFFEEMRKQPGAAGYTIIYAEPDSLRDELRYEFWISDHIKYRKFPADLFHTTRVRRAGPMKIELWRIPAGAKVPALNGELWTSILPANFTAFEFGTNMGEMCSGFNAALYAEFLIANPTIQARLLVTAKSAKAAAKLGEPYIEDLVKEFGIPRERFRISYKNRNPQLYGIKYWLEPAKKK